MTWSDHRVKEGKGIFIVGEIGDTLPKRTSSKLSYLLFTIIGLGFLGTGIVLYFYSALIMTVYSLRELYWNWGFSSLALAILSYFLSIKVRDDFGYFSLENQYNFYKVKSLFGKTTKIDKTKIFALSVQHFDRLFGLRKNLPFVIISTYDETFEIPLYKFQQQELVLSYFSEIADLIHDDYYTIFQTSEINFPSMFSRVWQQPIGKLGITILIIYLYFGAWGAFSMMLYPSNVLYARSFFLNNPEISFSYLPGYNSYTIIYLPPNSQFILGTDWFGRDIFARLVYGTVHAFGVGILAALIYVTISLIFGIISAVYGGLWDELINRFGDFIATFPPILLIIIIATFVGGILLPNLELYYYLVFALFSLVTWPLGTRLIRTETRNLLKKEYLIAARRAGSSEWRIIKYHILPKLRATVVLLFIYTMTEVIIAMTMIGIIGLGAAALTWGSDLERAILFTDIPLRDRWWVLVYPAIWVMGLIIGLTLLSDSIRDQFQISINRMTRRTDL